jgi:hypothetical protein
LRTPEDDERLDAAYARYDRANAVGERKELAEARLVLCRLLEGTGWSVPSEVRDQMARDEKTLRKLAEEETQGTSDLLRPPSHRQSWFD